MCLGYGVMVTQQILVLFFLVRIRVAQHKKDRFKLDLRRSFYFRNCFEFLQKVCQAGFCARTHYVHRFLFQAKPEHYTLRGMKLCIFSPQRTQSTTEKKFKKHCAPLCLW